MGPPPRPRVGVGDLPFDSMMPFDCPGSGMGPGWPQDAASGDIYVAHAGPGHPTTDTCRR